MAGIQTTKHVWVQLNNTVKKTGAETKNNPKQHSKPPKNKAENEKTKFGHHHHAERTNQKMRGVRLMSFQDADKFNDRN